MCNTYTTYNTTLAVVGNTSVLLIRIFQDLHPRPMWFSVNDTIIPYHN